MRCARLSCPASWLKVALATARYDHGRSTRWQAPIRGPTSGRDNGSRAGYSSARASTVGDRTSTATASWFRRRRSVDDPALWIVIQRGVDARSLPGHRARAATRRFTFVPDFVWAAQRVRADTAIRGNPYVPSPAPPTSAQPTTQASDARGVRRSGIACFRNAHAVRNRRACGPGFAAGGQARGFGSLILTKWISPDWRSRADWCCNHRSRVRRHDARRTARSRLASGPRLFPHFVNAPKVGASSCSVRLIDGTVTIELRAPSASHVELSGDFTRWRPMTFEHVGGDRWTLTTRLVPGVHRFVVRVDGGTWLPAPGLPQAVDAYEGTVSVIVAP